MGLVLVVGFGVFIVSLYFTYKNRSSWDVTGGAMIAVAAGILSGVVTMIFVMVGSSGITYKITETIIAEEYQLVTLEDGTAGQGTFLFLFGTYRERMVYRYMIEDGDGALLYREHRAGSVRVYEEDRDDAIVQVIVVKKEPINYNSFYQIPTLRSEKIIVFRVPEGTVSRNLNIDLKD